MGRYIKVFIVLAEQSSLQPLQTYMKGKHFAHFTVRQSARYDSLECHCQFTGLPISENDNPIGKTPLIGRIIFDGSKP